MSKKEALRRQCLKRRGACTDRAARSRQIVRRLTAMPAFWRARTVMLYMPVGSEVDTRVLARYCLLLQKRICLPLVDKRARTMQAVEIQSLRQLQKGAYGILEPPGGAACREIDMIVVPGAAFDACGNRIGYGAGYYDRFLPQHPESVTVGLCYACCMVDDAAPSVYDVPVQWIITEERTVRV